MAPLCARSGRTSSSRWGGAVAGVSIRSLRGLIISGWEAAGRPRWDLAQTTQVAEDADKALANDGANPAPAFRASRLVADRAALRIWTTGCRFEWLGGEKDRKETPLNSNPPTNPYAPLF